MNFKNLLKSKVLFVIYFSVYYIMPFYLIIKVHEISTFSLSFSIALFWSRMIRNNGNWTKVKKLDVDLVEF